MVLHQTAGPPKVLVVEDEMMLRMRAVDIVEDAGFTPIEAVNADEALAILESRSDIELLFTDIQMPGSMDGLKLAHAVHERWPSIKIILVSGQLTPTEADKPTNSRFFGKPLEVKQMIAELQKMIGQDALRIMPADISTLLAKTVQTETRGRPETSGSTISTSNEFLTAETDSLRLLLEQAGIDAKVLLAQAGIDAKEREAADKLQKLILEELHHRIKNTLATVSAIASQSLRTATSIEHGQHAIEGRLIALGRAHDLLLQARWANADLANTIRGATEPYDNEGAGRFSIAGPDVKNHVRSGDRSCDDAQRALHQHHEIRSAVCAFGTDRHRMEDRRRKAAVANDLVRRRWSIGTRTLPTKLWNASDRIPRAAIERRGPPCL